MPGRGGGIFIHRPQHAEDRTQFDECLTAHAVDGGQGFDGALRLPVRQVQGGGGLDVDDRDVVGHDVVEVAGDPYPLLTGHAARLFVLNVPLCLGALVPEADALGPAKQDKQADSERKSGGCRRGLVRSHQGGQPERTDVARDEAEDRGGPLAVVDRRTERHHEGVPDRAARVGCRRVPQGGHQGDGENRGNEAPPPDEREPARDEKNVPARRDRDVLPVVPGGQVGQPDLRGRDHEGHRDVDAVTAPGVGGPARSRLNECGHHHLRPYVPGATISTRPHWHGPGYGRKPRGSWGRRAAAAAASIRRPRRGRPTGPCPPRGTRACSGCTCG